MQKIDTQIQLNEAILCLELQQAESLDLLKEQSNIVFDSINPINIIKNTFKEVVASKEIKENILNTSIALAVGYLSKKVFEEESHSPIKKILGSALMFGITTVVAENSESIQTFGKGLIDIIKSKFSDTDSGVND
jgi:hypothetical protein